MTLIREMDTFLTALAAQAVRIVAILIVVVVAQWALQGPLYRALARAFAATQRAGTKEEATKRAETLAHVLTRTGSVLLFLFAGLSILLELWPNIGPLLAGLGVASIAVGLGAQTLVRDLISGFFIILENQYSVGDFVEVANRRGHVEYISLRRTVLRDLDGTVHSIPNSQITVVSNFTRERSNVILDVPISYQSDLERAIQVINRIGQEMAADPQFGPMIIEPPRALRVEALQESTYVLRVQAIARPNRQWDVSGELRRRILQTFPREGLRVSKEMPILTPSGVEE